MRHGFRLTLGLNSLIDTVDWTFDPKSSVYTIPDKRYPPGKEEGKTYCVTFRGGHLDGQTTRFIPPKGWLPGMPYEVSVKDVDSLSVYQINDTADIAEYCGSTVTVDNEAVRLEQLQILAQQ